MNAKSKALKGKTDSHRYETKKAYHIIVSNENRNKYHPKWGGLDPETRGGVYRRHKVNPKTHVILTHSDWAKPNMKKDYDKYKKGE